MADDYSMGNDPVASAANGSGTNWLDILKQILGGAVDIGKSVVGDKTGQLALLALLGKLMDKSSANENITPREALTGQENLRTYSQDRMNEMSVNPAVTQGVVNQMVARTGQTVQPTVTPQSAPQRFNPYAANPNAGRADQALLARLAQLTNQPNPRRQNFSMPGLQASLNSRFPRG